METKSAQNDYLSHTHYDKLAMPSAITRFLWNCAGADKNILWNCTYADHVKYACLGGIVFATGIMAGMAGGYAFYTIFQPKGGAIEKESLDMFTFSLSFIFGLFWVLMIFNLDRFIISSTGKGDGTDSISAKEWTNAIPRLIMGTIIALTISKPIEIRMFKTEIDNKLHEKQLELQKDYEIRTNANFQERLKVVETDLEKIYGGRQKLEERYKAVEQAYQDNMTGRANVKGGRGQIAIAQEKQMEDIKAEIQQYDKQNADKKNEAEKKRKALMSEKEIALSKNQEVAKGLDGLLERIKLAHEIAGFWISTFITLLFWAIELAPIFFKLMMIKSPYDYLDENHKAIIIARHGVQRKGYLASQPNGGKAVELEYDLYLLADKLLEEKVKLLESEMEIKRHIIEKHVEKKKLDVDNNPDKYIES